MSGWPGGVQGVRLTKAVVFLLALVMAVFAIEALTGGAGGARIGAAFAGIDSGRLVGEAPLAALEELERQASPTVEAASGTLFDGVALPDGARDLRVSGDGSVMGFMMDCGRDEAFSRFEACFLEEGWRSVPLGGATGATFVKSEGERTWAFVTCTGVGASTAVVVRC